MMYNIWIYIKRYISDQKNCVITGEELESGHTEFKGEKRDLSDKREGRLGKGRGKFSNQPHS